ncbi:MAG: bifunctional precorrin-2 dehydrogenase/sirohydrochlorin ferrochelatase [Fusobacterium gastrosuis]|uniref:precorrin-2 dehydrogenase/sirohydrochlorin ferrochelatase family protein n=1 Tax=Fusobacterium gastrosuis TaxID=1755100 RepID=UPI002A86705A|nr:bifunctional precorrin-2 dehydrogenase/sirohydrochlorin ferrochelatase [Fusobacterium gastrosuis]
MGSKFFPVSIKLEGKNVLVIGAGKIAYRKIETIIKQKCNIKVITKSIEENRFEDLMNNKKISLEIKEFKEEDLEDIFLVIAATSNEKVNRDIVELCMNKNILVNNITSKDEMNLRFSSIYESEDFQISVSTKEGNPKRAIEIKNLIKEFLEKEE